MKYIDILCDISLNVILWGMNSVLHPVALFSLLCKTKALHSILRSLYMPSAMQAQDFLSELDGSHWQI